MYIKKSMQKQLKTSVHMITLLCTSDLITVISNKQKSCLSRPPGMDKIRSGKRYLQHLSPVIHVICKGIKAQKAIP